VVPSRYTVLEVSSTDEENHKNPQTMRCGSSESNPAASEVKSEDLPLESLKSVIT